MIPQTSRPGPGAHHDPWLGRATGTCMARHVRVEWYVRGWCRVAHEWGHRTTTPDRPARRPAAPAPRARVALLTGLGRHGHVSAGAALPVVQRRRHADQVPLLQRLASRSARSQYRLSSTYKPNDLRSTSYAGLNAGYKVRRVVITDLKRWPTAARRAGARLAVQSAYRSYATQKSTFQYWVRVHGYAVALKESARAGHSEHQLGTTLDFRSYGGSAPWDYKDWGRTKAGQLAQGERLEVRLRHVLPEGQDQGHLLHVRALALPLRRPHARQAGP